MHIVDGEYPEGKCTSTFLVDDFSNLFLNPSILLICLYNRWLSQFFGID